MVLDTRRIREDFPILGKKINGKQLIYFDNAATSQKPRQVINAIREFYEEYNANIHRGLHYLSQKASELYEEAHDIVARFIGARNREEVVFVRNTTEGLNLVAYAWGLRNIREGDEIVLTIMEHHSNFLPWFKIAEYKGARVRVIGVKADGRLNIEEFEKTVSDRTKLVAVVHMSNVTGVINDVKKIARIAHEVGARVVVDSAQSVPHIPVNVRDLGVDFLAFSGHKMLGPTGIGVLYISEDVRDELDTFLVGGDTIREVHYRGRLEVVWHKMPWRYEAGTPNIAGGIGLAEAIKYLEKIGLENIHRHEQFLVEYLFKRLDEEGLSERIRVLGPRDTRDRGGIVSFTLGDIDPHATAMLLDEEGIAVRSGFHCAQPLHEAMGFERGSVRASFYLYNTREEIDYFVEVLKRIVERQG
ncbi:MAG: cysteine desulfurase [Thermoprotei archaeon]